MLQPCSCNFIQSRGCCKNGKDRESSSHVWRVCVERPEQERSAASSVEGNKIQQNKEARQATSR